MYELISAFETHGAEYDAWYDKYPFVFESEIKAIQENLPVGKIRGIEVGLGTGRFAQALGIKEGVEPIFEMRRIAFQRGIEVMDAVAERLPYKDLSFDFVLMINGLGHLHKLLPAFKESHRVLKKAGAFIVGFVDKNSSIGRALQTGKEGDLFFRHTEFYSSDRVTRELKEAGFAHITYSQTLFESLDGIKHVEPAIPGSGKGSFIVIKAIKK